MKIAARLAIAIAIPLVVFAGLAADEMAETWHTRSNVGLLNRMAKGVTEISQFVHGLQRERGITVVVAGTKGAQMLSELTAQRKQTDDVEAAALKFVATLDDKQFNGEVAKAQAAVAKIGDVRRGVDRYAIAVPDAFNSYTGAVANLLALAGDTAKFAERGDTTGAILAYVNLQQASERAGQERAGVAGGIAKGKFDLPAFARVIGLQAAQDGYFSSFLAAATVPQREFFARTMTEPEAQTVNKMRATIAEGALSGDFKGLDAKAWFSAATARMDLLAKVEDRVASDLISLTGTIESDAERSLLLFTAIALICFVVTLTVATLIARGVTRPLRMTGDGMTELAQGNFTIEIPNLSAKDEIGEISRAAASMAQQLGGIIQNVKRACGEVSGASHEIAGGASDLSQRTEEQAASLEQTSAAMEEMTSTVKRNSENAREANGFAASAAAVADRSSRIVANAVDAMARIEESSGKISDIIVVIDEIARQTNLLALNAAVEAARAGEAGRGFAVVATEVRTLAQRSALAAKDINGLISTSSGQVKEGVELVNNAGSALGEIVAAIGKVASTVSEIAHASAEQSTGLEEINKALTQLDTATQQNSALVEESAATAKMLEMMTEQMTGQVAVFRLREEGSEPRPAAQSSGSDPGPVRRAAPPRLAAAG